MLKSKTAVKEHLDEQYVKNRNVLGKYDEIKMEKQVINNNSYNIS